MSEAKSREAICAIGASIFNRGLTAGSSGNISVRVEDGWLMTPTNASLGRLDPARLSKLAADGRLVSGDAPTKESFLHRVMYEERNGTGAVVHLHSTHSVAVSCFAEIDPADVMPPITAYYVMRVGRLPLVPYFKRYCSLITVPWSPGRASTPRSTRSRNWKKPQSSTCCCAAPKPAF
jgi:3-dehydro-4-phosphotetronate decarboxylase